MTVSDNPRPSSRETLIKILDDLLPQTQCRQCGTEGCLAYARAMVEDGVPINRCAPGGSEGIRRLALALGVPEIPLDPDYGQELPFAVARIRTEACIGCSWCIKVCPTDAIAGSPKHLHGVIEKRCTGCALCLPACPMDCIDMEENGEQWTLTNAHQAREWFRSRTQRLARQQAADHERLEALRHPSQSEKASLISRIMAKARESNAQN